MSIINPNNEKTFLLEDYRKGKSLPEKLQTIIKEICVFDSIHDFSNTFYDNLPKKKDIEGYGSKQPSIFTNSYFSFVNDVINPITSDPEMHFRFQQNNKVSGGLLGVLNAYYTKSSTGLKPNIEKYYLDEIEKLGIFNKIEIPKSVDENVAYLEITNALQQYAQLENDNTLYVPIVVDVQKRLFSILKANKSTSFKNDEGKEVKLAYVLNREMMNDAAGKINFKETTKRKKFNFLVDIDQKDITYLNSERISIGFDNITFTSINNHGILGINNSSTKPNTLSKSKLIKPWCNILFPEESLSYQTIINDSSINSISNAKRVLRKHVSLNAKDLIIEQNKAKGLKILAKSLDDPLKFKTDYKTKIIENILRFKESNNVVKDYASLIFFYFLRKRIGDQLQALSCLKRREYGLIDTSDDSGTNLIFSKNQNKPCIFCSYDVIAVSFALANQIPCILEKADKTIVLYIPKVETTLPTTQFGGASRTAVPRLLFTRTQVNKGGINNFEDFTDAIISDPIIIVKILRNESNPRLKDVCTRIIKYYKKNELVLHPFLTDNFEMVNVLASQEVIMNPSFNPIIKGNVVNFINIENLNLFYDSGSRRKTIYFGNEIINEKLYGLFELMFENTFESDEEVIQLLYSYSHMHDKEHFSSSTLYGGGGTKQKIDKNFILSILRNKDLYKETKNFDLISNYIIQKILYIYELKLTLDYEVYEMYFDLSRSNEIAENREIYCVIESLKKIKNVNLLSFLNYLTKIRDSNTFANDLLNNFGDITDYVFDNLNHELINIISSISTKETSNDKKLYESSIKIYNSIKNFNSSYFSNLYNRITIPNLKRTKSVQLSALYDSMSSANISSARSVSNRSARSAYNTNLSTNTIIPSLFSNSETYSSITPLLNSQLNKSLLQKPILAFGKKSKKKRASRKKSKKRVKKKDAKGSKKK